VLHPELLATDEVNPIYRHGDRLDDGNFRLWHISAALAGGQPVRLLGECGISLLGTCPGYNANKSLRQVH
jgi:hypothetical protein